VLEITDCGGLIPEFIREVIAKFLTESFPKRRDILKNVTSNNGNKRNTEILVRPFVPHFVKQGISLTVFFQESLSCNGFFKTIVDNALPSAEILLAGCTRDHSQKKPYPI
jgi:hypothetical protein